MHKEAHLNRLAADDDDIYMLSELFGFLPIKVLVPGNINNAFLDNLIPDTPYSVTVSALYADGEGSPVKGNGKTRK